MKKVKLIVTSVALFTVIGGALAFKAKSNYGSIVYTSTTNSGCTIQTDDKTTTTDQTSVGPFYVSTTSGGSCPTQFYLKKLI